MAHATVMCGVGGWGDGGFWLMIPLFAAARPHDYGRLSATVDLPLARRAVLRLVLALVTEPRANRRSVLLDCCG